MAKNKGFIPGGGGGMQNIMRQAQKAQRDMEEAQEALAQAEFTATAGGGAVAVVATGDKLIKAVKINPEAVDPDDVEMLEDMVLSAVNEALRQANEAYEAAMAGIAGGMAGLF